MPKLDDILDYIQPGPYIVSTDKYDKSFKTPVLTAGKSFLLGYSNEETGVFPASKEHPVILFDDFTTEFQWVDFPFKVKSSACKILKPKISNVNLKYVFYAMKTIVMDIELHKRYWISTFSKKEIELPDLKTQNAIVNEFISFEKTLILTKEIVSGLDEMIKSRYEELFSNKNYPEILLGEEIKTTSGGTPLSGKREYYSNGNIPWLTSGEINQGIIYEPKNFITKLGLENSSAKYVPANSVVIAMYGATAGKVGLVKFKTTTNQAVCVLLPNPDFLPEYLMQTCRINEEWMISNCNGAGQPNISQAIIKNMNIIKAPLDKQKEYVDFVEKVDELKLKALNRCHYIQELFKTKIAEYFVEKEA